MKDIIKTYNSTIKISKFTYTKKLLIKKIEYNKNLKNFFHNFWNEIVSLQTTQHFLKRKKKKCDYLDPAEKANVSASGVFLFFFFLDACVSG